MVLMDEATSSIDHSTDSAIQTMLRTTLRECTVLTIAHRLHTIIDSDNILVIDAGAIVESGTPDELMKRSGGKLQALVAEGGPEMHGTD